MVGSMAMPANYRYQNVVARGRPQHDKWDDFRIKHPPMARNQRAKIFNPFDALRGFQEALEEKEVRYELKRELDEGEKEELNRKLIILRNLTLNQKIARANQPIVCVRYYVPCKDVNNFAYGFRGQYQTIVGICWSVNASFIKVEDKEIPFSEIVTLEASDQIFPRHWEEETP